MRKQHILLVAHFAGSPGHGMVYGHYYLAREWVKAGHRVTVLADAYAHTRHTRPTLENNLITREFIDGIDYLWLNTRDYQASNWLGRILNIFSFSAKVYFSDLALDNIDIVICSSHHPLAIFGAEKIARANAARLVFEVRDIWPLTLVELGGISRWNPVILLMQYAENRAYRNADKVVSVLAGAKAHMLEHGMREDKFVYIPNGAAVDDVIDNAIDDVIDNAIDEAVDNAIYKAVDNAIYNVKGETLPDAVVQRLETIRASGDRLLVYAGRVVLANALDTLITAIAQAHSGIQLVILGDGDAMPMLKEQVQKAGLESVVHFFDAIPKNQVPEFLAYADICYMGFMDRKLYRFGVSPTKINDYLLAGKPVLYACNSPDNVVRDAGAGFCCEAGNPEAIANALRQVVSCEKEMLVDMGQNGRRWILENRNYPELAGRFLESIVADT